METERSGLPYWESKPSAHRHRTARTTRQINGAKFLEARAIRRLLSGLPRVSQKYVASDWRVIDLISFILARNYNGFGEYMDWTWRVHDLFWFILTRNYNGFVVDMDSLDQADLHFSKELQWFRGGHGFISSSESSFRQGITIVWEWILIGHVSSRFDPRYKNTVSVNS